MPTVDLPQGTVHYREAGPGGLAPPDRRVRPRPPRQRRALVRRRGPARRSRHPQHRPRPAARRRTRRRWHPTPTSAPRGVAAPDPRPARRARPHATSRSSATTPAARSASSCSTPTPPRIGRLVLTNCDAFDQFPPKPFDLLVARRQQAGAAQGPHGADARHRPAALAPRLRPARPPPAGPRPDAALRRAAAPTRACAATPQRSWRAIDPADLLDVSTRLGPFDRPVRLVWGDGDRFFKLDFAQRLARGVPATRRCGSCPADAPSSRSTSRTSSPPRSRPPRPGEASVAGAPGAGRRGAGVS